MPYTVTIVLQEGNVAHLRRAVVAPQTLEVADKYARSILRGEPIKGYVLDNGVLLVNSEGLRAYIKRTRERNGPLSFDNSPHLRP